MNGSIGYRWTDALTTSLKVINLFDQEIQQHVFGDVMRRQVVVGLKLRAPVRPDPPMA